MKFLNFICLGLFILPSFSAKAFTLDTIPEQGGLVYGSVFKGEKLFFKGSAISLSKDRKFVFGLPYDAPKEIELTLLIKGKKVSVFVPVQQKEWKKEEVQNLPKEKLFYSKEVKEKILEARAALFYAREKSSFKELPCGFIPPLKGRISSQFGAMRLLNKTLSHVHLGVDIAASLGTEIKAPFRGRVVLVLPDAYLTGKTVLLDHGFFLFSSYSHLSKISVEEGDILQKGDVIGQVGHSGRATGNHLHLSFFWKQTRLNPLRAFELSQKNCLSKKEKN
ncbi:MAG: M23 family metallopeptidase [Alphaproteobacteria bacterium]|nr:M23 family metallopeptidase [Alphaproteobacteria bacterium]